MKTCATEKCKIILAFAAAILCALLALPAIASAEDRIPVEKPALEVSLVYDGTEKTVSLPASQYYTSESITCINAGTYVLRVSLKDRHNYCWDDMTTDDLLLEFTVEKAVFDESTLIYEDETYVFDGKEHFIDVVGLPRSAKVIFNTVKSEPGVYDSVARIDLGNAAQISRRLPSDTPYIEQFTEVCAEQLFERRELEQQLMRERVGVFARDGIEKQDLQKLVIL